MNFDMPCDGWLIREHFAKAEWKEASAEAKQKLPDQMMNDELHGDGSSENYTASKRAHVFAGHDCLDVHLFSVNPDFVDLTRIDDATSFMLERVLACAVLYEGMSIVVMDGTEVVDYIKCGGIHE